MPSVKTIRSGKAIQVQKSKPALEWRTLIVPILKLLGDSNVAVGEDVVGQAVKIPVRSPISVAHSAGSQ